jgi:hypothetical protein
LNLLQIDLLWRDYGIMAETQYTHDSIAAEAKEFVDSWTPDSEETFHSAQMARLQGKPYLAPLLAAYVLWIHAPEKTLSQTCFTKLITQGNRLMTHDASQEFLATAWVIAFVGNSAGSMAYIVKRMIDLLQ